MRRFAVLLILISTAASAELSSVAGYLGLGVTRHESRTSSGAKSRWLFVRQLAPNGPAARAGLKPQDVITHIDRKRVSFENDAAMLQFFSGIRSAQVVTFTLRRGATTLALRVTAEPMPPEFAERWKRNRELAGQ